MHSSKILLVDENPAGLLYLQKTLSRLSDAYIATCSDAIKALDICKHEPWDLVIVDYQMPQMDGLEFIRQFRQLNGGEDTPILMVTASIDLSIKHQLLDLGVVDFLQKPVDASEITARSRNLIGFHRATLLLKNHNQQLKKGEQEMITMLAERERESLLVLAWVAETRDPQTSSHLARIASYSKIIALELGLSEDEAEEIYLAAPMHDVGKLGLPDRIILKDGTFTPEEWVEMKRHTNYGFYILGDSETPVLKLGGEIALNHHESWDGSGYPNGKKGEEIPLSARIVAVADVFDALMSLRPYKRTRDLEEALDELNKIANVRLDANCVKAFMKSIDSVKKIIQLHAYI